MARLIRWIRGRGIAYQIIKIILLLVVAVATVSVAAWIGNPHTNHAGGGEQRPTAWTAPPERFGTTDPPLPSGFPSMEFPPPMIQAPKGSPQPVPTRYGLTYSVPGNADWRPSNTMVTGWTNEVSHERIATFGAVSDYGYGYCREHDGSALANIGVHGRTGVDLEQAAREDVDKARLIFSDETGGRTPEVTVDGPVRFTISGRPAIRFTARLSGVPQKYSCDPTRVDYDIIATPAYSSAETAVFMIEHHLGLPKSLSDKDIDALIDSLRKTT
ncbi:hypothetical protein ACFYTQ_11900 [Nocardia sp. NPDC004068]|uniref:hypothetical protein n=1 Tax=Nocardia sp. NPDC004068 TaxID=3364303 RepID=UPI003674DD68